MVTSSSTLLWRGPGRATIPETPRYSADVERNEAKALRNVTAVKTGEGSFIDEYTDKQNCDRISWANLGHYLTYPSILRNRCGCWL